MEMKAIVLESDSHNYNLREHYLLYNLTYSFFPIFYSKIC